MSETTNERTTNGRTSGLTTSERHELLAAERRRVTLDILAGRVAPVDLVEVATEVVTREDGVDAGEEATKRVTLSLHHIHLPKMADLGVLEYDPDSHRIEPTASTVALTGGDRDRA